MPEKVRSSFLEKLLDQNYLVGLNMLNTRIGFKCVSDNYRKTLVLIYLQSFLKSTLISLFTSNAKIQVLCVIVCELGFRPYYTNLHNLLPFSVFSNVSEKLQCSIIRAESYLVILMCIDTELVPLIEEFSVIDSKHRCVLYYECYNRFYFSDQCKINVRILGD